MKPRNRMNSMSHFIKKPEHTPGTWVNLAMNGQYGVQVGFNYLIDVKSQADAALIAAAPEMLEALIEARSLLETIDGFAASEACIQLSAVIAKARGES